MGAFTPRHISSAGSRATAYDHGAHVAQWDVDGVPVVWVSRRASFSTDVSIRGGIPVCWPWFANGPAGDQQPSHGVARTALWTMLEHEDSTASWGLTSHDVRATDGGIPSSFKSTLSARVQGRSLTVAHTVVNTGDAPISYEVALHTYLHVGDVRDVSVTGLDAVGYFDKVSSTDATQAGDVRIDGEIDRIYDTGGSVRVVDPTLDRVVTVTGEGANNVVIWNPGPDGAREMDDFADDEWTQMVCVETANIGKNAVNLPPLASHTTALTLDLSATPDREER